MWSADLLVAYRAEEIKKSQDGKKRAQIDLKPASLQLIGIYLAILNMFGHEKEENRILKVI